MKVKWSRSALVSLGSFVLLAFLLEALAVAWAVQHSLHSGPWIPAGLRQGIVEFANYPSLLKEAFDRIRDLLGAEPGPLLVSREDLPHPDAVDLPPDRSESGYLLFSGVAADARQSVIRLIRLADNRKIWEWRPDFDRINERSSPSKHGLPESRTRGRAVAPLLQRDGSVIFTTGGSRLVRLGPCSEIVWVLPGPFHHSLEQDADGDLWVPSVYFGSFRENAWMAEYLRDDAVGQVSVDGKVLSVRSFSQVLIANGLRGLLFGQSYTPAQTDPIHMNDIEPAIADGEYWRRGDLLISAGHLSTVFLYRPSTGMILWHKTGPWLSQHDANFLDSHRISVFGNDVILAAGKHNAFPSEADGNQVYVYDFRTDSVATPFESQLKEFHVRTVSQGRAQVTGDGSLFVEETDWGRHLRFANGRLLWSRTNWYDGNRVGGVAWSRYLPASDVVEFLKLAADTKCPQQ